MNSKRNVLCALIAAVALIGGGCGGFNGGGSVSPATFLLPGIGHNAPQPTPKQEAVPAANSPQLAFSPVAAQ